MNFEEFLRDTFENVEELNMDKIRRLALEGNAYFVTLKGKMASSDPKVKEEALQSALEIREFLERRLKQLSEETGFDFLQFTDPSLLTDQQKEMVAEITAKINQYSDVSTSNKNKKVKPVWVS